MPELVEPVYVLYAVATLEFMEKRKFVIAAVLSAVVLLVIALGLWLARQEALNDTTEHCRPATIIRETIEQHRQLFREKPIVVKYIAEADPEIQASPTIFRIMGLSHGLPSSGSILLRTN